MQEEERLKHEIPDNAHYVNHAKENFKKGKGVPQKMKASVQMKRDGNKDKLFLQENGTLQQRLFQV